MKKEHMKKQYPHWCGVLLLYLMACISVAKTTKSVLADMIRLNLLFLQISLQVREVSVLSSISTVRTSETTHQKFILL